MATEFISIIKIDIKTILKCPLTEIKFSNALLKAYFSTIEHKIWMHDY